MIRKIPFDLLCSVSVAILLNPLFPQLARGAGGIVVGWGYNVPGQTNIPPWLNDAVAVAAGFDHALALRDGGTVVAWGDHACGQATVLASLRGVLAVCGGRARSMPRRQDGPRVQSGGAVTDVTPRLGPG